MATKDEKKTTSEVREPRPDYALNDPRRQKQNRPRGSAIATRLPKGGEVDVTGDRGTTRPTPVPPGPVSRT